MSAQRPAYTSDLSDEEWQILTPLLPPEKPGGRPRKYPLREVISGQRLRTWVADACGWILDIVQRPRRWGWYPLDVEPPPMPAFTVLPRR
jgi:transposase